jgi:hypothetical protein
MTLDGRNAVQADDRDELLSALRELDLPPDEVATLLPVARRLGAWVDPRVTPADQGRLLAVLGAALPQPVPVRQQIRERLARRGQLARLLATVHSQVSVLRLSFWVLSAVLALLGIVIELAPAQNGLSLLWLRALAPLLAYLSVASVFRGAGLQTLEWELACPPSALQLISARLVIVLGYDIALGLLLSLVAWSQGEGSFLVVTLHWLVPLLLVAGLALALSLRFSLPVAVGVPYGAWLALLIVTAGSQGGVLSPRGEVALGLAGIALLTFALWRLTWQIPDHLLAEAA